MTAFRHAVLASGLIALSLAPAAAAQTARTTAQATANAPVGSEAWLRMRGEAYSRAPESKQDPAEVSETARLNAAIAAGNNAAAATEQHNAAVAAEAEVEYREDLAAAALQRAERLEAQAANDAQRAEAARARATWEAMIRACERSGRTDCRVNDRPVG